MTELQQPGSYPLAVASAAKLSALADRMEQTKRDADEYRARLERQAAEYWARKDAGQ
jgi:hypothetical protein